MVFIFIFLPTYRLFPNQHRINGLYKNTEEVKLVKNKLATHLFYRLENKFYRLFLMNFYELLFYKLLQIL